MAGLRDRRLQHYWCDGLIPLDFAVSGKKCRMSGTAYFGETGQDIWSFVVLLGDETTGWDRINWRALLPANDVTGWLAIDFEKKLIKLNPLRARPDTVGGSHAATENLRANP